MYVLKAFLKIDSLTKNQPNVVSDIGELSDLGYTYSKNKGFYTDTVNHPGFEIVSFTSKADDTGAEIETLLKDRIAEFVFKTAAWMNSIAAITPQWFTAGTNVFLDEYRDVIDSWSSSTPNNLPGSVSTYDDVNVIGISEDYSIVQPVSSDRYYVHWVEFEIDYVYSGVVKTATVKLWLNDEDFRLTFDDFEIVVVPMVSNLDDFFDTYSHVNTLVTAAKDPTNVVNRFELAKGEHPPTIQKVMTYSWHDSMIPPNLIPTPWGILIYGAAGDNLDAIREALKEYILDHSAHTEEEWGEIFPGIFRVAEFMLIPMWHRYSIPNASLSQGIYSPISSAFRDRSIVSDILPALNHEYIALHMESFVFPYKSIAVQSIPSQFNNVNLHSLQKAIPNWAHISTDTYDFSRMNLDAQSWAEKMANAINIAESMTNISPVGAGLTRLHRSGVMYVAFEDNEKTYLVCSKKYFKDNIPDILASAEVPDV